MPHKRDRLPGQPSRLQCVARPHEGAPGLSSSVHGPQSGVEGVHRTRRTRVGCSTHLFGSQQQGFSEFKCELQGHIPRNAVAGRPRD